MRFAYFLLSLAFLTGCFHNREESAKSGLKMIDTSQRPIQAIKGNIISDNSLNEAIVRVALSPDNTLLLTTISDSILIKSFNLTTGALAPIATKGSGKEYPYSVVNYDFEDGAWFFDLVQNKFLKYDLNPDNANATSSLAADSVIELRKFGYVFNESDQAVWQDKSNLLVSLGNGKNRFASVNLKSGNVKVWGNYPRKKAPEIPDYIHGGAFQSLLRIDPARKFIVTGMKFHDRIDIFRANGDSVATLRGPGFFNPLYRVKKVNNFDVMSLRQRAKRAFLEIVCLDNAFYALYSGQSDEDTGGKSYMGRQILKFDYDGNLLKTYELNYRLLSFAVSGNGKNVYGVHEGRYNRSSIIKFDLE